MDNFLTYDNAHTLMAAISEKFKSIQVNEMPVASTDYVGIVCQYIGATTANYTHNYFYECIEDTSTNPATYSWVPTNVQAGDESSVQADWDQADSSADDFIKNKPTLGTASAKDVATSGDASATQVVMGNDSRLNNSISSTSTTSPLTGSADARVQGITIYGQSEVVEGEIVSAGEGYAVVDLGTLTWTHDTTTRPADGATIHAFYAEISLVKTVNDYSVGNLYLSEYKPATKTQVDYGGYDTIMDKICAGTDSLKRVWIYNSQYNDYTAEQFKTAMSGVLLCYQEATPTNNTIAIKTDDGTGIDGTMATFATALPLRSVSDTVRDKLTCTAESKQVETVCGKVKLADLTWEWWNQHPNIIYAQIPNMLTVGLTPKICNIYPFNSYYAFQFVYEQEYPDKTIYGSGNSEYIFIKDTDYSTKEDFVASLGDAELVYELAEPVTTPLTDAEIYAFRGLKTYDSTTNITISDDPEFELDYLKNTENGQAVAGIQTDLQGQIDDLGGGSSVQSDWNETDSTADDFIKNKPTIPDAQINSDWNASSGKAQILNKPTLGTAAALDVATSGNASSSQVVKGNDSRLSDARTPTSHTHTKSEITDFPTLGTAAEKNVPSSGNASSGQVVMGNDSRLTDARNAADVSAWAKASTKPSYTASEVGALASSLKGANNGVAELDANGKVPSSQLPSYVDDVIEAASISSFPTTGETGKIYVATDTNKTYRWSGSAYTEISASLSLGETSSTAYRGDRGKTAYDHSQSTHARTDATKTEASSTNGNIKINGTETTVYTHPGSGTNPHGTTKSDVGLGNVGNFKAVSTIANQGLTDAEKLNARANIGAGTSNFNGAYSSLSGTPTLGTAAAKDVASSGNASSSQVVMGNDSRLSDARTPTSHNQASSTINAMTGYSKPSSTSAISTSDTLNGAIGKLEKALDGKQASGSYASSSHTHTKSQITDMPTSLPASNTTDTYSASGTAPVSGKAVAAALGTLDVSSVGGSGKYIQSISETDGKISATAANMPSSLPASNTTDSYSSTGTAPVSGKAVAAALGTLDVSSVGGSGKYIQSISETDGKISATAANMPTSLPASDVYSWAKASNKPTYTASEVGAASSSHNQASNTINAMTGYSKPSSTSAITTSDTLNGAIGKLEKKLDTIGATVINDSTASSSTTYSSSKIEDMFNKVGITWGGGTDAEIVQALADADAGKFTPANYWAVGDTRMVTISAISSTAYTETQNEQTVEFVIVHVGLYKDKNDKTVNFIVQLKDCLQNIGQMDAFASNTSSWDGTRRRTWCNDNFYNAIPSSIRSIFKQFKTITASAPGSTQTTTSLDHFALPAEKEISGTKQYSASAEAEALTQWDYYKVNANRIKGRYVASSAKVNWWARSPVTGTNTDFVSITADTGSNNREQATTRNGIAPFGCI